MIYIYIGNQHFIFSGYCLVNNIFPKEPYYQRRVRLYFDQHQKQKIIVPPSTYLHDVTLHNRDNFRVKSNTVFERF